MNFEDIKIIKYDEQIEEADKLIEEKKREIQIEGDKFSGTALISFQTENMRNEVMKNNGHSVFDQITAYQNDGKSDSLTSSELAWMNQKLFLELAHEPNDIDWEFAHVKTNKKIKWRSFSWTISLGFVSLTFILIYLLQVWIDSMKEFAEDNKESLDDYQIM